MDNRYEMPLGLSFQLGLNEKALNAYAHLSEVEAARNVTSKAEMQQLVSGLEKDFM